MQQNTHRQQQCAYKRKKYTNLLKTQKRSTPLAFKMNNSTNTDNKSTADIASSSIYVANSRQCVVSELLYQANRFNGFRAAFQWRYLPNAPSTVDTNTLHASSSIFDDAATYVVKNNRINNTQCCVHTTGKNQILFVNHLQFYTDQVVGFVGIKSDHLNDNNFKFIFYTRNAISAQTGYFPNTVCNAVQRNTYFTYECVIENFMSLPTLDDATTAVITSESSARTAQSSPNIYIVDVELVGSWINCYLSTTTRFENRVVTPFNRQLVGSLQHTTIQTNLRPIAYYFESINTFCPQTPAIVQQVMKNASGNNTDHHSGGQKQHFINNNQQQQQIPNQPHHQPHHQPQHQPSHLQQSTTTSTSTPHSHQVNMIHPLPILQNQHQNQHQQQQQQRPPQHHLQSHQKDIESVVYSALQYNYHQTRNQVVHLAHFYTKSRPVDINPNSYI